MGTSRVRKATRLGRHSNGMVIPPEEFDAVTVYDDRYCYELIHGVVVVSPIPSEVESDPNGELEFLLRLYKRDHPQGTALEKTMSERDVRTGDSRRRADRVVWAGLGRVPNPSTDVPTIVAEFVSKSKRDRTRDYVETQQEYLAAGVAEYWVIDRFQRIMTVFRRPPALPAELVVKETEVFRTDLLPGFELPLTQILAVADDWSPKRQEPPRR
jgi:Uma2 family endonuclease